QPHVGLDRPHLGAILQQPPDSTPRRIYRTHPEFKVGAGESAIRSATAPARRRLRDRYSPRERPSLSHCPALPDRVLVSKRKPCPLRALPRATPAGRSFHHGSAAR